MPATAMSSASKKKALVVRAETAAKLDPMLTEALQDVMDALVAEPAKMLPCLRDVKSDKYLFKDTGAGDDEAPFHSTYKRLYRSPKDFLRSYLATESDRSDLDDAMLLALDKGGESGVRDLFYYAHDCSGETPWPMFCHDRGVWRGTFRALHQHLGAKIKQAKIKRQGAKVSLDWTKFGQYILLPEADGPKQSIKFCQLDLTAPLSDFPTVESGFLLQNNFSHTKATLKYKRSTASCLEFFDEEQRAKIHEHFKHVAKKTQDFANEAEQAREERDDDGAPDSEEGEDEAAPSAPSRRSAPPLGTRGKRVRTT